MKKEQMIPFLVVAGALVLMTVWMRLSLNSMRGEVAEERTPTTSEVAEPEATEIEDAEETTMQIKLTVNGHEFNIALADNSSAQAFYEVLQNGPVTVAAHDYGDFEKVGDLGFTLPTNDEQITTEPGDLILYQGNQITLYYDENTYTFTRLGEIIDVDTTELREVLGEGDATLEFSL